MTKSADPNPGPAESLPSVLSYLNYRDFLKAWFEARKRIEPSYSYARFGKDGGCSRAALANVIGGNRSPRSGTLDAFARAMGMTPTERNYLGLLVELEAAPTQEERRAVIEKITGSEKFGQFRNVEEEPSEDMARYYANWWTTAIRELVLLPGFRDDPEWIAQELHPPITVEQARTALDTLIDLGFVERTDSGIIQRELAFSAPRESAQYALGRYHREVLPSLMASIDTSLHRIQHLASAILLADDALVAELKKNIHDLIQHATSAGDAGPWTDDTRVYQLAVQLLPVSGVKDGEPDDGSSSIT